MDYWYEEYSDYISQEILKSDITESEFKRNKKYTYMLEHCSSKFGGDYLNNILREFGEIFKDNNELMKELISKNDSIGKPSKFRYSETITCSPSNLKYLYHALLALQTMKIKKMCKNSVIEIGGGYGGLCFYMTSLAHLFDVVISTYNIFDLEMPRKLQDIYLQKMGVKNFRTVDLWSPSIDNDLEKNSFMVSEFAFSEISIGIQKAYADRVLNKYVTDGMIIWNAIDVYDFMQDIDISKQPEVPNTGGGYNCRVFFGKKKMKIKVKNSTFNHEPTFLQDTDKITFIKNNNYNENGDVNVENGDIVVYTDKYLYEIDEKADVNIALMIEGVQYHNKYYDYIKRNHKQFDIVLTWSKELLELGENFRQILYGTSWLHDSYIKIWDKSKLCSHIVSYKKVLPGHQLRHELVEDILNKGLQVEMFGDGYKALPFPTTKGFDPEHSARHISQGKIHALKEYMFSIAIENAKADYEFTEKLIDCFLSGTVPIYYGCPSIGNFFDINGMLIFDTKEECVGILDKLTPELYSSMRSSIESNFERAQQYKTFQIGDALTEFIKG
tara:strand:+ start:275 stop:1942 length:1668 start_codon:yes stop_codon:yes gene_type:complete